jgi:hypothetical protein
MTCLESMPRILGAGTDGTAACLTADRLIGRR